MVELNHPAQTKRVDVRMGFMMDSKKNVLKRRASVHAMKTFAQNQHCARIGNAIMETGLKSKNHVHRNVQFTQAGFVIFQSRIKSARKVLTLQASHYVTFDGAKWDITAGCEMILATNRCFKTKNDTSDYFKVKFILIAYLM